MNSSFRTENMEVLLECFVAKSRNILEDALTGIYLHGSAAMGCFQENVSDIDLIVVIKSEISDRIKRRYLDMTVELNRQAPAKGIELSVVREETCRNFTYPTPFELHFSTAHLAWYRSNPDEYVRKMKGTDKDLAAHFTVIYHRGKKLYGREIREVFAEVSREDYLDSIQEDVENAEEEILENPMYFILNLCRVLAYKREGMILSKQEGGQWGIENLPEKYAGLAGAAAAAYRRGGAVAPEESIAREFAGFMLEQLRL